MLEVIIIFLFNFFFWKDWYKKYLVYDKKVSILIRNIWNVDFVGVVLVFMMFIGRFENDVVVLNCEGNFMKVVFVFDFEVIVCEFMLLYIINFF